MNEVVKAIDVGIIALICLALLGPVDDGDDVRRALYFVCWFVWYITGGDDND